MAFDYNARQAYLKKRLGEWKKAHEKQERALSAELSALHQGEKTYIMA